MTASLGLWPHSFNDQVGSYGDHPPEIASILVFSPPAFWDVLPSCLLRQLRDGAHGSYGDPGVALQRPRGFEQTDSVPPPTTLELHPDSALVHYPLEMPYAFPSLFRNMLLG